MGTVCPNVYRCVNLLLHVDTTLSNYIGFRSFALVFGGWCDTADDVHSEVSGDLHTLDLERMRWDQVEREYSDRWPKDRHGHSFTMLSSKFAVLVGGDAGVSILKDCWLLDIDMVISQMNNKEEIWTSCEHHGESNGAIAHHRAVIEPCSRRLWILGMVARWL